MWSKLINYCKKYQQQAKHEFGLKMMRNSMSRQNNQKAKKLYHNHHLLDVKVKWLRSELEIQENLTCCLELDYKQCFLITNKCQFNTLNYLIDLDVVIVDLSWKVTHTYKSMAPNTQLQQLDRVSHIFVLTKNSVNVLNIQIGDIMQPMSRVN